MVRVSTRMRQCVGEDALLSLDGMGKSLSCAKVSVMVVKRVGGTIQPRGGTCEYGRGAMYMLSLLLSTPPSLCREALK